MVGDSPRGASQLRVIRGEWQQNIGRSKPTPVIINGFAFLKQTTLGCVRITLKKKFVELHRIKMGKGEYENSLGDEGNTAFQLPGGEILEDLQTILQRPLLHLRLDLSESYSAQHLLQLRYGAPGGQLDGHVLHRGSNKGKGDFTGRETDDLNETAHPDLLERGCESLGVADDIKDGVENEVVLFDESVKLVGFAGVIGTNVQGGLDADISDVSHDDVLDADDVFLRSGWRSDRGHQRR